MIVRDCEGCPARFEPVHGLQRFCSPKCRDRAWRNRRRPLRTCPSCGGEFQPIRYQRTVYCTVLCKRRADYAVRGHEYNRRRLERYRDDPEYRQRRVDRERERYHARGPDRLQPGSFQWAVEKLEEMGAPR